MMRTPYVVLDVLKDKNVAIVGDRFGLMFMHPWGHVGEFKKDYGFPVVARDRGDMPMRVLWADELRVEEAFVAPPWVSGAPAILEFEAPDGDRVWIDNRFAFSPVARVWVAWPREPVKAAEAVAGG